MAIAALLFAGCASRDPDTSATTSAAPSEAPRASAAPDASAASPAAAPGPTRVQLQLQSHPQAQFAGYFAAIEQGYYAAEDLDVHWLSGGRTIAPQTVGSAADGPEFTVTRQAQVLPQREVGSQLVNIAQVFQRSGTLSLSWTDSNITEPVDFKGKNVGVRDLGYEWEVIVGAKLAGLEPGTDYTTVVQDVDMALLLSQQVDVASAAIYDEYAQVLEATNPATGQLYQPTDLNVINWNDEGSAMLPDAVFARADWLAQAGNEGVAVRFLKASFQGWIYCRDNPADCIQYTLKTDPRLGAGHQAWMLNEVNALIWPSPNGLGIVDQRAYDQTVDILREAGILTSDPGSDAIRTDLAETALAELADADTTGETFVRGTVEVTPGGT